MFVPHQHPMNRPAGSPAVTWCSKNPGCSPDTPCDECLALADGRIAEVHLIEYRHHHVRVPWAVLQQAWLADQPLYLPDPGAADDPQPGWLGGDKDPGRHAWDVLRAGLDTGAATDDQLGEIRIQEVALEPPHAGQFAETLALWLAARQRLRESQARDGASRPAADPGSEEGTSQR